MSAGNCFVCVVAFCPTCEVIADGRVLVLSGLLFVWFGFVSTDVKYPKLEGHVATSPPHYPNGHEKADASRSLFKNKTNKKIPNIWTKQSRCLVSRGKVAGCFLVWDSNTLKPVQKEQCLIKIKSPYKNTEATVKWVLTATDPGSYVACGCCMHRDNIKGQEVRIARWNK